MKNYWKILDTSTANRNNGYKFLCVCVCGTKSLVSKKCLKNGKSRSCGCRGVYIGLKVNKFTVIGQSGANRSSRSFLIKCECGFEFNSIFINGLPRRKTCKLCDVVKPALVHGECHKTKEHNIWRIMRHRCKSTKNTGFKYYGARGIKVCERWDKFENFIEDMGRCPPGHSIDRIDGNGDYEPSNCRWATANTQNRNRRNTPLHEAFGESKSIAEWAELYGVDRMKVWRKLKKYKLEQILKGEV